MITLPVGFIAFICILLYSLADANAATFMNAHAIVLVMVGTVAVFLMSSPRSEVLAVLRSFAGLFKGKHNLDELRAHLMEISKNRGDAKVGRHELIDSAMKLWEQGVEPSLFEMLLRQKLEEVNRRGETSVAILRNLAKYPPALGMTGTVVGLVSVFSNLSVEARENVGPALALALTATFYGLIAANVFIMPVADRLLVAHLFEVKVNEDTLSLLLLINRGEPVHQLMAGGSSGR